MEYRDETGQLCPPNMLKDEQREMCIHQVCHSRTYEWNADTKQCEVCPPYSAQVGLMPLKPCLHQFFVDQLSPEVNQDDGKLYLSIRGRTMRCPLDENGEPIPFEDKFGQLQCQKYSDELREANRGRKCRANEILSRALIGCEFSCPAHTRYDYFKRECLRPNCQSRMMIKENGDCVSC